MKQCRSTEFLPHLFWLKLFVCQTEFTIDNNTTNQETKILGDGIAAMQVKLGLTYEW